MNSENQPIDPVEQLQAIIQDMDNTIAKFSIVGAGVAGNIHDGFTVNPGGVTSEESGTP
jgi:hypothetical protein